MKIYISGKISGRSIEEAKKHFEDGEKSVSEMPTVLSKPVPINPFKLDHAKAYALEAIFEKEKDFPEDSKTVTIQDIWNAYMDVDLGAVLRCDGIYMLKGWGESKGARIEYSVAKEMGLTIMYQN
ncbi:MAG: DUF4406 domain-containing protein [Bacteroidota bacterium]